MHLSLSDLLRLVCSSLGLVKSEIGVQALLIQILSLCASVSFASPWAGSRDLDDS